MNTDAYLNDNPYMVEKLASYIDDYLAYACETYYNTDMTVMVLQPFSKTSPSIPFHSI